MHMKSSIFFFILHMYFCLHDGSDRISQVRRSTAWLPVLVYSWCCIYRDPWCLERHIYSVVVFHLLPRLPDVDILKYLVPLKTFWCSFVYDIILQISLLEECGSFERALGEMHKKESKIVSAGYLRFLNGRIFELSSPEHVIIQISVLFHVLLGWQIGL